MNFGVILFELSLAPATHQHMVVKYVLRVTDTCINEIFTLQKQNLHNERINNIFVLTNMIIDDCHIYISRFDE